MRLGHGQAGFGGALALLGAGFAVQHIVAGDLLLAGAHQRQFDLILDVFDMQGAARRHAAHEGGGHLRGEVGHGVVDAAGRSGIATLHSEEGLGDGHADLVVGVGHHGAVTLDDLQAAGRGGAQFRAEGGAIGLHGCSTFSNSFA